MSDAQLRSEIERLSGLLAAETGIARAAERENAELKTKVFELERKLASVEVRLISFKKEGQTALYDFYKGMWEKAVNQQATLVAELETAHARLSDCRSQHGNGDADTGAA